MEQENRRMQGWERVERKGNGECKSREHGYYYPLSPLSSKFDFLISPFFPETWYLIYIGMIKSLWIEISLNVPRGTLKRKGEKSGEAVRESGSSVDNGEVSSTRETGRKMGYNGLYITYPYFVTLPFHIPHILAHHSSCFDTIHSPCTYFGDIPW